MTDTMTETTDEVLVSMLTENTGRHMLDSGGAYGRDWERNQGLTVDLCKARPEITPSTWERDGVTVVEWCTLDLFHFLRQRVDYNAELDNAFLEFADGSTEPWFADMEAWLRTRGVATRGGEFYTVNTYNNEDLLSQIIQYTAWEDDETGDYLVALSVHGGCDARGGYTRPRVFSLMGELYGLVDNADMTATLTEPDHGEPDQLTIDGSPSVRKGRQLVIDVRGGYEERYDDGENVPDEITFSFGETPVTVADDGTMTVADGPAAGWTVDFYPPCAS